MSGTSASVSEGRGPRRRGRAGAVPVSPARLGVVKVGAGFAGEYPDGDASAAEVFATLIRAGHAVNIEVERAMLRSFGVPQSVLNSLAVIEGADRTLTPSEIGERTLTSS